MNCFYLICIYICRWSLSFTFWFTRSVLQYFSWMFFLYSNRRHGSRFDQICQPNRQMWLIRRRVHDNQCKLWWTTSTNKQTFKIHRNHYNCIIIIIINNVICDYAILFVMTLTDEWSMKMKNQMKTMKRWTIFFCLANRCCFLIKCLDWPTWKITFWMSSTFSYWILKPRPRKTTSNSKLSSRVIINMQSWWIYVSIVFVFAILVSVIIFVIVKRKLRFNKLRRHLIADYVVECHDINTKIETRLLLKQLNQDYLHNYCPQQSSSCYTTSL